jgi:TPR repeat protein
MPLSDTQPDDILRARTLLLTRRFAKLDEWLLMLMRGWQSHTTPDSQYGLIMSMESLFGGSELDAAGRLELLREWVQLSPQSYHAQVLLGMFWHEQAWAIRSQGDEDALPDSQWLGAQLCCDHAVQALLRAVACHPRPTHAYRHLMTLSGGFGEPYWLRALFAGEVPLPLHQKFSLTGNPVWAEGLLWLEALGAGVPEPWPSQLPEALAGTRSKEEDATDYWLRLALTVRPGDTGTVESWLVFQSPQWGGSPAHCEAMIDSALMAGFDEATRRRFRAEVLLFALGGDVAERGSDRAEQLQQRLAEVLTPPPDPALHQRLLEAAAPCLAYWQDDDAAGLACYAKLLALAPDLIPAPSATLFISRAVLASGVEDPHAVLPTLLQRACAYPSDALLAAFAASACAHGLYGVPENPRLSASLLDYAASLLAAQPDRAVTEQQQITLAHDMALNGDLHAAYTLLAGMAQRGSALHSYELYLFYRDAWHEDVPEALRSAQGALQAAGRAAEAGLVPAMFAYANALREGADSGPDYAGAMHWYQQAIEHGDLNARYWRATWALEAGSEADRRQAVENWLPEIIRDETSNTRAEAAWSLGMAWREGLGCEKNRFMAQQLFELALSIHPGLEAAQVALAGLSESLRDRMVLWQDRRKSGEGDVLGDLRAEGDARMGEV